MRRNKDDKRVLRSGNGQQNKSKRFRRVNNNSRRNSQNRFSRNSRRFAPNNPYTNHPRRVRKKKKANKTLVFLMVLALVAFVIGAGIGVSLSLDDGVDDGPQYENVTKEMTSNLNQSDQVVYDEDYDRIDYNENGTLMIEPLTAG